MRLHGCKQRKISTVKRATVTYPSPPTPVVVDPRHESCADLAAAGLGPYLRGRDPEYAWYRDDDGDGQACEPTEAMTLSPSGDWRTARLTRTLTPSIVGDAIPQPEELPGWGARGHLNALILDGTTEIWRGVATGAPDRAVRVSIAVPAGIPRR